MLTRRRVLAAKYESAEGTGETLTGSDGGILVIDPKIDIDLKMFERSIVNSSLSKFSDVPGTRAGKITFKTEVKHAGSDVAPAIGKYLVGCGFKETDGSGTFTYTPASESGTSQFKSLTMWMYSDGVIYKLAGCRGNVKFSGKVGEPLMADFEFLGKYVGVVDGALITPTYESSLPKVLTGTTLQLVSAGVTTTSLRASSVDLDMGNSLQLRESVSEATGFYSCLITDRNPNGKIDPEMTTVATYDFYGKWLAATSAAITVGPLGGSSTQFERVTISVPKAITSKIGDTDRNGISVADYSFRMVRASDSGSGDDEMSILFS